MEINAIEMKNAGTNAVVIAEALYEIREDDEPRDLDRVAAELRDAGFDAKQAAVAIHSLTPRLGDLGGAFDSVRPADVVNIVSHSHDLSLSECAEVLYHKNGLDLCAADVAVALYRNPAFGDGAEEGDVIEAMKALGLDEEEWSEVRAEIEMLED